jgi:hypothetical protein
MSPDNRREYASVAHPAYKVRCTSFAAQERRCIFKEVLMKLYWIALCGLAVAKIAFAASPTADEESVYRSYLAAFSAITIPEHECSEQMGRGARKALEERMLALSDGETRTRNGQDDAANTCCKSAAGSGGNTTRDDAHVQVVAAGCKQQGCDGR